MRPGVNHEDSSAKGVVSPSIQDGAALPLPNEIRRLNRSPHPYHRKRPGSGQSSSSEEERPPQDRQLEEPELVGQVDPGDHRHERKESRSPTESGTEADDESHGFIKALPPPPARPRKGLRDRRGADVAEIGTPLLTPSLVDEEGRRLEIDYFPSEKSVQDRKAAEEREAQEALKKYQKRRRAEHIRRISEVGLIALIAAITLWRPGTYFLALDWYRELASHVAVTVLLLCVYPLRLLFHLRQSASQKPAIQGIRLPAAYDPATILYPVFLPPVIALSLLPVSSRPLLVNLILGLAAIPDRAIPLRYPGHAYSAIHWLISAVPLIVSENTGLPLKTRAPKPYMLKTPPPEGLHPELLVCLYPLHQALLLPLRYLTTTSLLPAELQLLSIALINLLLLTENPQARILVSLLWVGGLCILVLCRYPLEWGVALARVPKWKLRRAGHIIETRNAFVEALLQALRKRRMLTTLQAKATDSDADDDMLERIHTAPAKPTSLTLSTRKAVEAFKSSAQPGETQSAVEPKLLNGFAKANGDTRATDKLKPVLRGRRNTLPTALTAEAAQTMNATANAPQRKRPRRSVAEGYLTMTQRQATIRKWVYAAWTYLMVVLIILLPVRAHIGKYALDGHEAIGWVLGYLFGNIQPFRFWVVNNNLERWIALPKLDYGGDAPTSILQQVMAYSIGQLSIVHDLVSRPANARLVIITWWLTVLVMGLTLVLSLPTAVEVDTRRKVFHGMMVLMLHPTIFVDPCFVALALAIVLAVFLLLDLIRAGQCPPFATPLARFLTPYVDGRDLRGPVVVSHIFLLIGCAIPLWLSLAGVEHTGQEPWQGWDVKARDISMVAGVVCVGMGDAAASLVGRRIGRRKWIWAGGKSLEGSLAFAVAVAAGLIMGKMWLFMGGRDQAYPLVLGSSSDQDVWNCLIRWLVHVPVMAIKATVAACGASLMEAVLTGGNDNVIVPVGLWLLVRALGL